MLRLIIKHKGKVIQEVSLQVDVKYTIGRAKDNPIVLPPSPGVSRKHLEFSMGEEGQWCVKNLSQSSPLRIEGEESEEGPIPKGVSSKFRTLSFFYKNKRLNPPRKQKLRRIKRLIFPAIPKALRKIKTPLKKIRI